MQGSALIILVRWGNDCLLCNCGICMCLNVIVTNELDHEEEHPGTPIESETIVELDKTEAVIPPRNNAVSGAHMYIASTHAWIMYTEICQGVSYSVSGVQLNLLTSFTSHAGDKKKPKW